MGLEVTNCCFCVGLRTGSLILGYLGLVSHVVLSIIAIEGTVTSAYILANASKDDERSLGLVTVIIMSIFLVIMLLYITFHILLVVGIHKHKRSYVKAFLIFATIFTVLNTLDLLRNLAKVGDVIEIIKHVVILIICWYYLVVIRSYYLKMDNTAKTYTKNLPTILKSEFSESYKPQFIL